MTRGSCLCQCAASDEGVTEACRLHVVEMRNKATMWQSVRQPEWLHGALLWQEHEEGKGNRVRTKVIRILKGETKLTIKRVYETDFDNKLETLNPVHWCQVLHGVG